MPNELSFGVIESNWQMKSGYSARPMFDLFSHVLTSKIDGYNYEKVVGPESFREVMELLLGGRLRFILISCHGEGGDLSFLPADKKVKAISIRKAINDSNFRPVGLFVDACEFGTFGNAKVILSTGVKWFASYGKKVDWFESMSLVLLFCSILIKQDGSEIARGKDNPNTPKRLRWAH